MIANLPNEFKIQRLKDIYFGDADGITDELLEHPYVFCGTSPFLQIAKGRKRIIIGPKGSGKSAMFRLLRDKKITISHTSAQQATIGIQADINLKTLREMVLERVKINDQKADPMLKYRLSWEIYLILKILEKLKELNFSISGRLAEFKAKLDELFAVKKGFTLLEALVSLKKTVGVKFDTNQPNVHNIYTSIEPGQKYEDANAGNFLIVFDDILKEANECLKTHNTTLDILVDKLDDFVVKEDYDIQKTIFQSLLDVESGYCQFSNTRLFLFIREDLFNRLNLDQYGSDKVFARKTNITWSADDISQLIAKRFIFNYYKIFNMSTIHISYDTEELFLEKKQSEYLEESAPIKHRSRLSLFLRKFFHRKLKGPRRRVVNLTDKISWDVISVLLPEKIYHLDQNNKEILIPFKDFIKTHLSCANDALNPRLVISFFNAVFDFIHEYYEKNEDLGPVKKTNGRFQVIAPESFLEIYQKFKKETYEIYVKQLGEWQYDINTFHERKGNRYAFLYNQLVDLMEIDESKKADFNRFLAIMNHVGFLSCDNVNKTYENRKYTIPILFR